MKDISLKDLLEAGCHFGHQISRANPKAREFVYATRDKVQIIDLAKTKTGLEKAAAFVKTITSQGGKIIYVGTKNQARDTILSEARRGGVFYVTKRWIGGFLTNWEEIRKNLKRMEDLRQNLKSEKWTKKEKLLMERQLRKLESIYGGIEGLTERPQALFILDTHREDGAVREAGRVGVPIVGVVDTNANPAPIDFPIPANDDAVKSIELITAYITDAILEGKTEAEKMVVEKEAEVSKEEKKTKAVQGVENKTSAPKKTKDTKKKTGVKKVTSKAKT